MPGAVPSDTATTRMCSAIYRDYAARRVLDAARVQNPGNVGARDGNAAQAMHKDGQTTREHHGVPSGFFPSACASVGVGGMIADAGLGAVGIGAAFVSITVLFPSPLSFSVPPVSPW